MVALSPFAALRPPPELAARVAAPPYDVVDVASARRLAAGNPDSFLHVSRPEIDLPDGTDASADEVHAQGRRSLDGFVARGVLRPDPEPRLYAYRQRVGGRTQTGVVGCVDVEDYASGAIATHELTRPDKENDRVRHLDALDAHDEPVFLLARPEERVRRALADATSRAPEYEFSTSDSVEHVLWVVPPDTTAELVGLFADIPRLYVADGHHRSAAAARLHQLRRSRGDVGADRGSVARFPAAVFLADEVAILPYDRVVSGVPDAAARVADALRGRFEVTPADGPAQPAQRHVFGVYAGGGWLRLTPRQGLVDEADVVARLDVSVLQQHVLGPALGISDPRTDGRLGFVGGSDGVEELVRRVDSGAYDVAFALPATTVEELLACADAGAVMPPKSTWFEPKLRSGLFVHPLH
ncbi:DUF1015 domain-containing protein [Motilibacter aurantiacus]|uniref:DUF1015 domain-containing protein n=1 Tax=Motilibacter aurantiacus TaxID=2714955 RepID=UPI00140A1363|nr:DUF1015 family protein [Motilibacter aurantiacus]NHC44856.1 DUF1015 domain-containing protein [Motilibacter aurantiacus]